MSTQNRMMEGLGKVGIAVLGACSSMLCILGYYPLVPAFYAGCCLNQRKNVLLYIGIFAGMGWCMPVDPATGVIPEGVEAQATQAFTNLTNLVEASGAAMSQVVKTTVFIKEMNDFGKINEIYAKFFKEPYPSRSCVEVARLPKDVLLEVEAIVAK